MQSLEFDLVDVVKLSQQKCQQPIQCNLAYATRDNFLGRIVQGYHPEAAHICLMTRKAAEALCDVQNQLNQRQLGLLVFDSYRSLRAVKDFNHWMHSPVQDEHELQRKKVHYPHIEKHQLADLHYVGDTVSNHCFGDTVDLTLIHLNTQEELNMGACFDYFDELSHPTAPASVVGEQAFQNRKTLSDAMQAVGFLPFDTEFWHFTFHQRDNLTPLDIEITPELEGLGV
jgi:D-alanyl-D-alanine dipeptidase